MALWDPIPDNDPDEINALKKRITNQDLQYSALESELLKTRNTLRETKSTLDDAVEKLGREADRAVRLDQQLTERSESLENERIHRQNAETALAAASEKIKADELAAKQLQATILSLSARENGSNSALSELQREKSRLEMRTRELEVNLQQVINATTPARKSANRRPRSSSLSDIRLPALERELSDLKTASARYQADLQKTTEKLGRVETELIRAENEKISLERKLATEARRVDDQLREKEEEIERLHAQQGDVSYARQREEELMQRVEEEEAKVAALEKLVRGSRDMKTMEDALQRAEKKLKAEIAKVKRAEERGEDLAREKEEALDALQEAQMQVENLEKIVQEKDARVAFLNNQESELRAQLEQINVEQQHYPRPGSTTFDEGLLVADSYICHSTPTRGPDRSTSPILSPSSPDAIPASEVEKLLVAISRLRGERDGLRRDIEFLQAESRTATQTLETKLAAALAGASDHPDHRNMIASLQAQIQHLQGIAVTTKSQLELRATAAFVLVNHLQSRVDQTLEALRRHGAELQDLNASASSAQADQQRVISGLECSMQEWQSRVDSLVNERDAAMHQKDEFMAQRDRLRNQIAQMTSDSTHHQAERSDLHRSLSEAEAQIADLSKSLENVESERDSLSLQVTNLQTDIEAAQAELSEAEKRYSILQSQQLSSMSSGEVARSLKKQIEQLEDRVLRRTEQIGIHQHDIKRLETNMRLQEERIGEMTAELDTAMSEKESMVEDCAEAREARDVALKRMEDLEEEIAGLEAKVTNIDQHRDIEVTAVVAILMDAVTKSRSTIHQLETMLQGTDVVHTDLLQRLEAETAERQRVSALLHHTSSTLHTLQEHYDNELEQSRQATLALAVSQVSLLKASRSLSLEYSGKSDLEKQLKAVQDESRTRLVEIQTLRAQLDVIRTEAMRSSANIESAHVAKIAELELELQQLQQANCELETHHVQLQDDLERSQEELRVLIGRNAERVQADDDANRQLEQLCAKHAEETQRLQGHVSEIEATLAEARAAGEASDAVQKSSLEEMSRSKVELEERLRETLEKWEADKKAAAEFQGLRTTTEASIKDLQAQLDQSTAELQQAIRERDELQELCQRDAAEASQAKSDFESLSAAHTVLEQELVDMKSRHADELQTKLQELESCRAEVDELKSKLDEEIARHHREHVSLEQELQNVSQQRDAIQLVEAQLRQEISSAQANLKKAHDAYESLEADKMAIDGENTELRSQMHTASALRQRFENDILVAEKKSLELSGELSKQKVEVDRMKAALSEAQMQLTLQSYQRPRELEELRTQLKSHEHCEEDIADLKEQIQIMDVQMAEKTREIEDNDDQLLVLHKEKKKMMTQVTNLNRQVKQLKSKLSEAEASLTPSVLTSNPQPAPVASTSSMIPPVPPIPPTFRQSTPPTPRSRTRTPSGPFMSALQKQKTPETKGYVPVFRAKTPEPKQATTPEASVPIPTFSKGKKRPAPDDAESSAPVQGFTPEGALDPERNTDFALTPRVRKSLRTGFTPTRNTTSRPVTMLAPTSPARTSMPFVPPNTSNGSNGPIILDVTNNPRSVSVADSKAPKRTWLGKMRGTGHSRSATAPASRSNVFDRAPPGRGS